ncbi:hypothetical protein [Nocardia higoensis]|uniref:hypothetical protein n=1 Tax=Nocardia higoensis TaxID=228599 RepID=UPI0002FE95B0|nr:hypothetical protein [Nocardia higoensis]
MTADHAEVDILAHHSLLLAIPAFLPAVALVAIIVMIAVRDRRAEARENAGTAAEASAPDPGSPAGAGSPANTDAVHGDSSREREENR